MTAATDVQLAEHLPAGARQFPAAPDSAETTLLVLLFNDDRLPTVVRVGTAAELDGDPDRGRGSGRRAWHIADSGALDRPDDPAGPARAPARNPGQVAAGRDWSSRLRLTAATEADAVLTLTAVDEAAGLSVVTEVETIAGGALRIRHTLTNIGRTPYVVDGLDVVVPCPDRHDEVLDFTGRHERERVPQRHGITDGLWAREGRQGRPGLDAATLLITGPTGFGFDTGSLLAVHVAWSGNQLLRLERNGAHGTTIGGGEHLLPGEVVPRPASRTRPMGFRRRLHRRVGRDRGRVPRLAAHTAVSSRRRAR